MKQLLAGLLIGAGVSLAAPVDATAQMGEGPEGTEMTVRGTVIDVSCKFGFGLTGADHRMCAQVCADRGVPLAILASDGTLYVPVGANMPPQVNQNDRLKTFAEQAVTVEGTVFEAGGAKAIRITSVERS